jgi:hypothetical protein
MKFQPKDWFLDPQCDPKVQLEIAKVADYPYPKGDELSHKALLAVIYRFTVPERQQLRQVLHLMAAIERTDVLTDEKKAEMLDLCVKALAVAPFHCRDVRGHDPKLMRRQLAYLQLYAKNTNPFPAGTSDAPAWIKKHASEMWQAAELMLPCFCEYADWKKSFLEELYPCSSVNNLIETLIASKHGCSIVAMKRVISRSGAR